MKKIDYLRIIDASNFEDKSVQKKRLRPTVIRVQTVGGKEYRREVKVIHDDFLVLADLTSKVEYNVDVNAIAEFVNVSMEYQPK